MTVVCVLMVVLSLVFFKSNYGYWLMCIVKAILLYIAGIRCMYVSLFLFLNILSVYMNKDVNGNMHRCCFGSCHITMYKKINLLKDSIASLWGLNTF